MISAKEALSNIPLNAKNNELTKNSKQVIERLKYIKPGKVHLILIYQNLQLNVKGAK